MQALLTDLVQVTIVGGCESLSVTATRHPEDSTFWHLPAFGPLL